MTKQKQKQMQQHKIGLSVKTFLKSLTQLREIESFLNQLINWEAVLPVWVCLAVLGCQPVAQWHAWSLCTEAPVEQAQDPRCWLPPAILKYTCTFNTACFFLPSGHETGSQTHKSSPVRCSVSGLQSILAALGLILGGPSTQLAPVGCAPSDPGAPHPAAEPGTQGASAQCNATQQTHMWYNSTTSCETNFHTNLLLLQFLVKLQVLIVPHQKMQRKRFLSHGCRPIDSWTVKLCLQKKRTSAARSEHTTAAVATTSALIGTAG